MGEEGVGIRENEILSNVIVEGFKPNDDFLKNMFFSFAAGEFFFHCLDLFL